MKMKKYFKNKDKTVNAKGLAGNWYTFANGEPVEVAAEDVDHLDRRPGLEKADAPKAPVANPDSVKKKDSVAKAKKTISRVLKPMKKKEEPKEAA